MPCPWIDHCTPRNPRDGDCLELGHHVAVDMTVDVHCGAAPCRTFRALGAAVMAADVRAPLPVATGSAESCSASAGPVIPSRSCVSSPMTGSRPSRRFARASVRAARSRRGSGSTRTSPRHRRAFTGLTPVARQGSQPGGLAGGADAAAALPHHQEGLVCSRTGRTCCSARRRPRRRPERTGPPDMAGHCPDLRPGARTEAPGPRPIDASTRCGVAEEQPTVGRRGKAGTGRVQQAFSGS